MHKHAFLRKYPAPNWAVSDANTGYGFAIFMAAVCLRLRPFRRRLPCVSFLFVAEFHTPPPDDGSRARTSFSCRHNLFRARVAMVMREAFSYALASTNQQRGSSPSALFQFVMSEHSPNPTFVPGSLATPPASTSCTSLTGRSTWTPTAGMPFGIFMPVIGTSAPRAWRQLT